MRLMAMSWIASIAVFVAAQATAASLSTETGIHNPNIVPVVAGCRYGFHPAYYGCAPNRRIYRYRPYTSDYIEEWDTYEYY